MLGLFSIGLWELTLLLGVFGVSMVSIFLWVLFMGLFIFLWGLDWDIDFVGIVLSYYGEILLCFRSHRDVFSFLPYRTEATEIA